MKKLKADVLERLRRNAKARYAIANLFVNGDGTRISDISVHLWIKKQDPRLTCISVLEAISGFMELPIDELTTLE